MDARVRLKTACSGTAALEPKCTCFQQVVSALSARWQQRSGPSRVARGPGKPTRRALLPPRGGSDRRAAWARCVESDWAAPIASSAGLGSVRVHVDRPTIGRLRRRFHSQLGDAWACYRRGRVFNPEQDEPARPTAARVAQTCRVAGGGAGGGGAWQTDRRDESAEFPGESAATDLQGSLSTTAGSSQV